MTSRIESIGLLAAPLALFAGAAIAQPPPPPPQAEQRSMERRVEVRIDRGGPPEIVINGERIEPERIRRRGDGILEIMDVRGDAIVEVIEAPRRPQDRRLQPSEPPRPMLGVVLAPIDPLLARHLRLDPAKVSMVAEVMDGSPAMEAGLVAGDLLLEIGGEPASIERIGEVVSRQGPDGEVKIAVLHDGEKRSVKLRPRMMAPEGVRGMPAPGGPGLDFEFDDRGDRPAQGGDWQDLRSSLERMRERMGGEVRERLQEWREQWEGPWGEEHIRRPLREFRDQTRREFDRLIREMERYEEEMRDRLERRWREMQEEWRRRGEEDRGREPGEPGGREWRGDQPRDGEAPRVRPRRDGGDGERRPGRPIASSPA